MKELLCRPADASREIPIGMQCTGLGGWKKQPLLSESFKLDKLTPNLSGVSFTFSDYVSGGKTGYHQSVCGFAGKNKLLVKAVG